MHEHGFFWIICSRICSSGAISIFIRVMLQRDVAVALLLRMEVIIRQSYGCLMVGHCVEMKNGKHQCIGIKMMKAIGALLP